jgi:rare lipoprotein A (peptidoglycan hydrolase)
MKLRLTYGVAVVAVTLFIGIIPTRSRADELSLSSISPAEAPDLGFPVGDDNVTKAVTQIASVAEIVTPLPVKSAPPTPVPPPKPPAPIKAAKHNNVNDQLARQSPQPDRHHVADAGDVDQKNAHVKAIGPCQLGRAAWYGGRYVGRRTSSGSTLDQIHATAAHRTLPLNSLVRVTNLNNGRSVIVRITDRGPVNEQLLIDMSPKAADYLAMKTAGIVPVTIEQVVEVADSSK